MDRRRGVGSVEEVSSEQHDDVASREQVVRNNTVVAALMLVGTAILVGAFEEFGRRLGVMPGWWSGMYVLPLMAPALTIALWFYTSRLERRAGTNLVRGQLVLLIGLSFVAALPSMSAGHSFSLYYGALLLLLATKIADQRLVIGGVIVTVTWLWLYFDIIRADYSLLLFVTAVLVLACILAPRQLRNAPSARS